MIVLEPGPSESDAIWPLFQARNKMWEAQKKLNCFPDCNVGINRKCYFPMWEGSTIGPQTGYFPMPPEPYLECYLPETLLDDILHRKVHWNNAEIGCLIEFDRQPNVYMPDVHMLMSFFHL